jgi:hypothetical protein
MKIKLNIEVDKPTANNRVYPKEVFQKALDKNLNSKVGLPVCSEPSNDLSIDLSKVIGFSHKGEINESGEIYLEMRPINNGFKKFENFEFSTQGFGTIDENGFVNDDYKLIAVFPVEKKGD